MPYKNVLKVCTLLTGAVFFLAGACQAAPSGFIKPLTLPFSPCLATFNDGSYEWGFLKKGICHGVSNQPSFLPFDQQEIYRQILWTPYAASVAETEKNSENCLTARGSLKHFPETGQSGCLCSVLQPGGHYAIGVEQLTANGRHNCIARDQSFSDYFIARHHDLLVNIEPPATENLLGYILISAGAVFSSIVFCELRWGAGPVRLMIAIAEILYWANFGDEDELMEILW